MKNPDSIRLAVSAAALCVIAMLPACSPVIVGVDYMRVDSIFVHESRSDRLIECETHVSVNNESLSLPQPHATQSFRISVEMNACEANAEAEFSVDSAFVTARGEYFRITRRLVEDTAWTLALRGGPILAINGRVLAIPTFRQIDFKPIDLPWMVDTLRVVYFVAPDLSLHKVEGRQEVTLAKVRY